MPSAKSHDLVIRPATRDDIPEILRQRRAMYLDVCHEDSPALAAMVSVCQPYLSQALADGSFRGWLALMNERIVGGGAVLISPWPSHPYDLQCRRATILNVYVYPEFRRRGIARRLMLAIIEWCAQQKFPVVYLHASKDGRHLYDTLGFEPTNEMKLKISS